MVILPASPVDGFAVDCMPRVIMGTAHSHVIEYIGTSSFYVLMLSHRDGASCCSGYIPWV